MNNTPRTHPNVYIKFQTIPTRPLTYGRAGAGRPPALLFFQKGEKPMDGLIRRKDAIKAMRAAFNWDYPYQPKSNKDALADGLAAIKAIPAVEPKCGEWLEKEIVSDNDSSPIITQWQSARCSVCDKYHTTPYSYYFSDYNYCPNCGADMRGETDE